MGNVEGRAAVIAEFHRSKLPRYAFDAQRVDLSMDALRKVIA